MTKSTTEELLKRAVEAFSKGSFSSIVWPSPSARGKVERNFVILDEYATREAYYRLDGDILKECPIGPAPSPKQSWQAKSLQDALDGLQRQKQEQAKQKLEHLIKPMIAARVSKVKSLETYGEM